MEVRTMRKLTTEQVAAFKLLDWRELDILRPIFPEVIKTWLSHPEYGYKEE
jgi:hypothetical protein